MSANCEGQAAAALAFAEVWSELLPALADDYGCTLTCVEAETAAALLRACGYDGTAGALIASHAGHDEPGDVHFAGEGAST